MDRTQEMNTSASFWLDEMMNNDENGNGKPAKVLSRDDVKEFIREELKDKKNKLKEYFNE